MKKDELEKLFERLQGDFDFAEPDNGHQERFLHKLKGRNKVVGLTKRNAWLKPMSIAATVLILMSIGLFQINKENDIKEQVVEIAPEVSQTEFYFASLIEEQVEALKNEKTAETAKLVDDTLSQLDKLDADYRKLERELVSGGNSQLILSAMILNFQTRIDLLKEVLTNIETIKNQKQQNDENFTI